MKHPDTGSELKPTVVSKTFVQDGVQINITDVPATTADGDLFFSDDVTKAFFEILDSVESGSVHGTRRIDISYVDYIKAKPAA
ncbi:MAG: hypothetical protein O3A46_08445 [Candidatus Poribacteria bacterium]|nr:hypothetical protein [Candidatus Poribacteria bacterium]